MAFNPRNAAGKLNFDFWQVDNTIHGEVVNATSTVIEKIDVSLTSPNRREDTHCVTLNIKPKTTRALFSEILTHSVKIRKVSIKPQGAEEYSFDPQRKYEPYYSDTCSSSGSSHASSTKASNLISSLVENVFYVLVFSVIGGLFAVASPFLSVAIVILCGAPYTKPGSGCFVTTAAYGKVDHPMVKTFRALRDEVLVNHKTGRAFIGWYEVNGPKMAALIEGRPARMRACRCVLTPLAYGVRGVRGAASLSRATKEYASINFRNMLKNGLG